MIFIMNGVLERWSGYKVAFLSYLMIQNIMCNNFEIKQVFIVYVNVFICAIHQSGDSNVATRINC